MSVMLIVFLLLQVLIGVPQTAERNRATSRDVAVFHAVIQQLQSCTSPIRAAELAARAV